MALFEFVFQNELMFGLETVSLSVKVDKECDFLNTVRVQSPAFMSIVSHDLQLASSLCSGYRCRFSIRIKAYSGHQS